MWVTAEFCSDCKKELTFGQVMDSYGTCPYCGHCSGYTVCDTITSSKRWISTFTPKWWQRVLGKQEEGYWEFK